MDERTLYCLLRGSVPGFGEWTSFLSCSDVRTQHPLLLLLLLFGLFILKTQELQLLLHLSALKRFKHGRYDEDDLLKLFKPGIRFGKKGD